MINKILTDLFYKWSTESKCGKCWVYVKTFNDHIKGTTNTYNPEKATKCCTHIFLEGLNIRTNKDINPITGMTTVTHCDYNIHLKIVELSDIQMQKGTELKYDKGIFDKLIVPLMHCFFCDFEENVCEMFPNGTGAILNEEKEPLFSFGDSNWAGLDYKLTIRNFIN